MQLSHHAMLVNDMDKAIEIYCGLLGLRLLRRIKGAAYKEVAHLEDATNGRRVELLLDENAPQTQFDYLGFEVDDVDKAFAELSGQGFTAEREPFDVAGGKVRTSFLRSPDGIRIELIRYATPT